MNLIANLCIIFYNEDGFYYIIFLWIYKSYRFKNFLQITITKLLLSSFNKSIMCNIFALFNILTVNRLWYNTLCKER